MTYTFAADLVVLDPEYATDVEPIRAIVERLMHLRTSHRLRGFAVCGAVLGDGATFIAVNLALSLAQTGHSTVLVDADLRDPTLHTLIRPEAGPGHGLSEVLAEECRLLDVVHQDVIPDLSVVYAGERPRDPSALLGTEQFRAVVDDLMRAFDFTVLNTPPANQASDAVTIASAAGGAIIVGRRDHTYMADLHTLAREITDAGSRVVGLTLNRF